MSANGLDPTVMPIFGMRNERFNPHFADYLLDNSQQNFTLVFDQGGAGATLVTRDAALQADELNAVAIGIAWIEYVIPPNYITPQDITLRIVCQIEGAGTADSGPSGVRVSCWRMLDDGSALEHVIADPDDNTVQSIADTSVHTLDWTIYGASLFPGLLPDRQVGDHVLIGFNFNVTNTDAANPLRGRLFSVTVL